MLLLLPEALLSPRPDPILCWGCDCEPCCRLFCCAGDVAGGGAVGAAVYCASNAGECSACDLMSSDRRRGARAAAFFIPVLLVLLVLFALIGVVVGIFFVTVLAQRWAQRRVHLAADALGGAEVCRRRPCGVRWRRRRKQQQ